MTTTVKEVLDQWDGPHDVLWHRAFRLPDVFGDGFIRLTLNGHKRETIYRFKKEPDGECHPKEGGSAVVFKVTQDGREVDFALKVLIADVNANEALHKCWQEECQVLDKLRESSAIPRIADYGQIEGMPAIIMDWMDGLTLEQRLTEPQWMCEEQFDVPARIKETRAIGRALCKALDTIQDAASGFNPVHGDIKPSNIVLKPRKSGIDVKLLDFGDATLGTRAMGKGYTPRYVSPEQRLYSDGYSDASPKVTHLSDQYSVGIVFGEMCKKIQSHITDGHRREAKQLKELTDTTARMTVHEPDKRFADFLDVAEALRDTSWKDAIMKKKVGIPVLAAALLVAIVGVLLLNHFVAGTTGSAWPRHLHMKLVGQFVGQDGKVNNKWDTYEVKFRLQPPQRNAIPGNMKISKGRVEWDISNIEWNPGDYFKLNAYISSWRPDPNVLSREGDTPMKLWAISHIPGSGSISVDVAGGTWTWTTTVTASH